MGHSRNAPAAPQASPSRCRSARDRSAHPPCSLDWFMIGGMAWSYQPSESSQAMITAVLSHSGSVCRKLITLTMNTCSSSGDELPGWPSFARFAFR